MKFGKTGGPHSKRVFSAWPLDFGLGLWTSSATNSVILFSGMILKTSSFLNPTTISS